MLQGSKNTTSEVCLFQTFVSQFSFFTLTNALLRSSYSQVTQVLNILFNCCHHHKWVNIKSSFRAFQQYFKHLTTVSISHLTQIFKHLKPGSRLLNLEPVAVAQQQSMQQKVGQKPLSSTKPSFGERSSKSGDQKSSSFPTAISLKSNLLSVYCTFMACTTASGFWTQDR